MKKISDQIICALFCLFIGGMLFLFLLLPKESFSSNEKRYLEKAPELTADTVFSGDFGASAEKYAADHLPGRDFFVSLAARLDRLAGLQSEKEIYVGKSGRLYERPQRPNEKAVSANMEVINAFAEKLGHRIDLMLVPSAGFVLSEDIKGHVDPYIDDVLIADIYSRASDNIRTVDVTDLFISQENRPALYYETDHHWTSFGAYTAYAAYADRLSKKYLSASDYDVENIDGFYGTTYSRACFWEHPAEDLALWHSRGDFTVRSTGEDDHAGLFYRERLADADKYPVFLGGNHPLVTVTNNSPEAEGSILVIRDSFANCFGCFLADSFQTVTLVDLRYYKKSVSELAVQGGYDNVLILYSLGNFLTDANIIWLA